MTLSDMIPGKIYKMDECTFLFLRFGFINEVRCAFCLRRNGYILPLIADAGNTVEEV